MNKPADDKELKAAFAEFKELLKRETEPVGASEAPEVSLEPNVDVFRDRPAKRPEAALAAEAFRARASEPLSARDALGGADGLALEPEAENARRRKLIYLSLGIVLAGVGGLGWTVAKGSRVAEEPAVADIAVPGEPAPLAAETEQAALGAPSVDDADQPAPESAEPPAPAANAEPAKLQAAAPPGAGPGAVPEAAAAAPLPAAPVVSAPPAAAKPVKSAAAPAADKPSAAAAAPAAPAAAAKTAPAATAALEPATRATQSAPSAAEPAKAPVSSAAKPAKTAKSKTKPAQTAAKPKPPAAAAADAGPAEEILIPPPAPAPPPPSENGGAFGFVKRTVNSVGSTIGNIGKAVIP